MSWNKQRRERERDFIGRQGERERERAETNFTNRGKTNGKEMDQDYARSPDNAKEGLLHVFHRHADRNTGRQKYS